MIASDLGIVMEEIGNRYVFTEEEYPILRRLSPEQKKGFIISHCVHHIGKSFGKLSEECESFDHSTTLDEVTLRKVTLKTFIDVLKLAEELGMRAEDLVQEIPQFLRVA